jgi:hypothetical protein
MTPTWKPGFWEQPRTIWALVIMTVTIGSVIGYQAGRELARTLSRPLVVIVINQLPPAK